MGDQLEELKRSANERESRLRDDLQRRIAELEKVPHGISLDDLFV